jgi:hypothetical protein
VKVPMVEMKALSRTYDAALKVVELRNMAQR